jgi:hypothetical protein
MEYLAYGDRENVRAFLLQCQDRVIYGTDLDVNPAAGVHRRVKECEKTYTNDWKVVATSETIQVEGRTTFWAAQSALQKI